MKKKFNPSSKSFSFDIIKFSLLTLNMISVSFNLFIFLFFFSFFKDSSKKTFKDNNTDDTTTTTTKRSHLPKNNEPNTSRGSSTPIDQDSNATADNSSGFSDNFFSSFLTTSTPNRQSSKNTSTTTPSSSGKLKSENNLSDIDLDNTSDKKSHSSKPKNRKNVDRSDIVSDANSDAEDNGSNNSTTYFTPLSHNKTQKKRANKKPDKSLGVDIEDAGINDLKGLSNSKPATGDGIDTEQLINGSKGLSKSSNFGEDDISLRSESIDPKNDIAEKESSFTHTDPLDLKGLSLADPEGEFVANNDISTNAGSQNDPERITFSKGNIIEPNISTHIGSLNSGELSKSPNSDDIPVSINDKGDNNTSLDHNLFHVMDTSNCCGDIDKLSGVIKSEIPDISKPSTPTNHDILQQFDHSREDDTLPQNDPRRDEVEIEEDFRDNLSSQNSQNNEKQHVVDSGTLENKKNSSRQQSLQNDNVDTGESDDPESIISAEMKENEASNEPKFITGNGDTDYAEYDDSFLIEKDLSLSGKENLFMFNKQHHCDSSSLSYNNKPPTNNVDDALVNLEDNLLPGGVGNKEFTTNVDGDVSNIIDVDESSNLGASQVKLGDVSNIIGVDKSSNLGDCQVKDGKEFTANMRGDSQVKTGIDHGSNRCTNETNEREETTRRDNTQSDQGKVDYLENVSPHLSIVLVSA